MKGYAHLLRAALLVEFCVNSRISNENLHSVGMSI